MSLRRTALLALTSATAAACAQSHEAPIDTDIGTRSGSRLRLRWLESDGVSVVIGFHDALLDWDCTVQKASDGELYCFPGSVSTKLFADSLCSEAMAISDSCAKTPATQATVRLPGSFDSGPGSCPSAELYTVLPPEPLSSYFAGFSAAECIEDPLGPTGPFMGQRLVKRVSESSLVHVREVTTRGNDPVQNRYYAGDDGSYLPLGFVDTRYGVCTPGLTADGRTRCLPTTDANLDSFTFADPACTIPVALTAQRCDGQQLDLIGSIEPNPNEGGCGSYIHRFFEQGESLTQAFGSSTCGELVFSPGQVVHRTGQELDPTVFSLLDAVQIGSGRLRASGWSAHGLEPFFLPFSGIPSFIDLQLVLSCSAATTTDSAFRCAPLASGIAYADSTCTGPYAYKSNACDPLVGPRFALLGNGSCQTAIHAVASDAQVLAQAFASAGLLCASLGNAAVTGYAVQDVVDPAMFAPMSERVE